MSVPDHYRQPWGRLEVTGRDVRLQILDPESAFELEPELIERIGEDLAYALAAPRTLLSAVWGRVLAAHGCGASIADALRDSTTGPMVAASGLRLMSRVFAAAVAEAKLDGRWLAHAWGVLVFDRLEIDGHRVCSWRDWTELGMRAEARWRIFAAQLEQTFAPLWTRSPYRASRRKDATPVANVPAPSGVPIAVQWADALAVQGHASDAETVLRTWTPVRVIEVVESAAYQAERERVAYEHARAAKAARSGRASPG